MARVTVEDCVTKVSNRFELVMLAAQRARDVSAGAELTVDRDNDKNPVVALREIAEETVEPDTLRELFVKGLQKHVEIEEPEEEALDLLAEQELMEARVAIPEDVEVTSGEEGEAEEEAEVTEDMLTVLEEAETDELGDGPEEPEADRAGALGSEED